MNEPGYVESMELIIMVFEEVRQADRVLDVLRNPGQDSSLRLYDAATLIRDRGGKIKLKETHDLGIGPGALFGAVVGGLVGLLGGPVGFFVGAATGAATGGVIAGKVDLGFSNDFLDQLGKSLRPGSSAILVLVEEPWIGPVVKILEQQKGKLFRHALKSEILTRIARSQ